MSPISPDPASVLAGACRELARLPGILAAMLAGLDHALWRARPAPREWSPVEIVCHLRDEEVEDFGARVRAVLDGGNAFERIDPERWAIALRRTNRMISSATVALRRGAGSSSNACMENLLSRPRGPGSATRAGGCMVARDATRRRTVAQEERETMRFGIFGSAQAKRGGPDVDSGAGFREFVENNVEAEALGYESSFVVEHHFTGFGQISATLNLLTWVGARTTTLRLGTAVMTLPWHNPVLLAEQAATLDLLSGGRLDFGIGQGYRHNEFAGFCIAMEEADQRFDESLEVILKAWTSDAPWSHHGKYWQFENVVVEPPTAQKPHPPLWMGAGRPASIKKVAAYGYNMLLDQFAPVALIGERIALFKSEVEARGRAFDPASVAVTRSLYVAMDAAERQKALETRLAARRRMERLAQRPDGENRASIMSYADTLEAAEAGALYGTPDEIATKLQALRDVGAEYVLLNSAGGPQSLRRFAREVLPAFAGAPVLQTTR